MTGESLEDLIDGARYPIGQSETAAARGRAALARDGAYVLDGFLRPSAVEAMLRELRPLFARSYYCRQDHNLYLAPADPAFDADHPRNRPQTSDKGCLADDQIPADALLRRLYDSADLRRFIAAAIGVPRLHPYEDPLGSLNVNVFEPGQQLGWHFDNADFAVTLMLQAAERGGVYEYVPGIRKPDSENYDAVARVLDGARGGVRQLAMGPGALVLFRGRTALHRVTPVKGGRSRIIAVLSYDPEPGKRLTAHTQRLFYGRAA